MLVPQKMKNIWHKYLFALIIHYRSLSANDYKVNWWLDVCGV